MPTHPDIMSLQALILALEKRPADQPVYLDFCNAVPGGLHSWRGIYAELAVGWDAEGKPETVAQWLDRFRGAIGETYEGYKGGHYTMDRHTPVHVDNWGDYSGTSIVGVRGDSWRTIFVTASVDD